MGGVCSLSLSLSIRVCVCSAIPVYVCVCVCAQLLVVFYLFAVAFIKNERYLISSKMSHFTAQRDAAAERERDARETDVQAGSAR